MISDACASEVSCDSGLSSNASEAALPTLTLDSADMYTMSCAEEVEAITMRMPLNSQVAFT